MTQKNQKYPEHLLQPVRDFLSSKIKYLESQKANIQAEDPYLDLARSKSNTDSEAFEHDRASAIVEQIDKKLEQTRNAIERIKSGEYGFCLSCENMINTDRLAIYPEAIQCVTCQETKETTS